MATSAEKEKALADLLGDKSLAEAVIKQAEATEKSADDRGLKYKEVEATEKTMTGTPTAVPATGANGINPIGLEKDKQKKAEGSAGEEASESAAESASEPDYEKMMKGLTPHIAKLIEEKMKAGAKESAEKEKGLQATIDQIAADVKELKGDLPRGIRAGGFRASVSEATILPGMNQKSADPTTQLDSIIDGWINAGKQH